MYKGAVNMISNKNRFLAAVMGLIFCFVILSSSCFIIAHADHDCSGEDCVVCMELSQCRNTISALGTDSPSQLIITAAAVSVPAVIAAAVRTVLGNTTLISLKVELLN
jgi:hypothetical protein